MGRKRSLSTTGAAVAAIHQQFCDDASSSRAAVKRRLINSFDDLADSVAESLVLLDWVSRHKYLGAYSRNKTMFSKLQARLSPDEWLHGKKTGTQVSAGKIIPLHEYPAGKREPQLRILSQLSICESFQRSAVAVQREKAAAAQRKAMANKRGWRLAPLPESRSCGSQ